MTQLSQEELVQLTGYQKPAKQMQWLRAQGIEPYRNGRGEVIVCSEVVVERQRANSGLQAVEDTGQALDQPNYEAMSR